jgi:tRNA threonylcarbamoyladenosine biosynthesis protein TsaB
MKILALDSTENIAAVAITDGKTLIGSTVINAGKSHSELLLPAIEALMNAAGLSYSDIDMFACSSGPGSFTGVRIGVSTVKGLAFGYNKPCVGVSATEALAYNFIDFDGIICPAMDARRSQLYNALFRSENGTITRLCDDRTIPASSLASELTVYNEPIYINGGGEHILRKAAAGNPNVMPTNEILKYQNGYSVALCALEKYESSENKDGFTDLALQPTYLRPSQAERMRNGEKE